jgi:hypothetical protein
MSYADYVHVTDIKAAPCVAARKSEVQHHLPLVDESRVLVVKPEIEAWYLAGLDDVACRKLSIRNFRSTDSITKELLMQMRPARFAINREIMLEILNWFSLETAIRKNESFRYFCEKYLKTK